MKHSLPFIVACLFGIGVADAAVRDTATQSRTGLTAGVSASTARTTSATTNPTATTPSRGTTSRTTGAATTAATTSPRTGDATTSLRGAATDTNTSRGAISRAAVSTSATNTRKATTARSATGTSTARRATTTATARSAIGNATISRGSPARAATMTPLESKTFGTGYNICREAYFTCMDQFCAYQDESYRRCVCSSRLTDIKNKERALSQTADQLQDFKDLNIEAIPKTGAEVKAMLTATAGENIAAASKDKSGAAQKLAGISNILAKAKSKSLSTAGTLDIAGDINEIWATTDLTSGVNIANLSGEALYNAVHAQCVNLVADNCESTATLNMVISAYGMYIENDCTMLLNNLAQKKVQADGTIRATEREMNVARLENYNAHNSTSINDCIAQVRRDITAEAACGPDYIHCLDVSGMYLNRDTGAPIYTANFYQLETQISLSGNVLTNQTNRLIVNELNSKRMFAERGLETCRDLADDVWQEFMRQAIGEIYQGQQERIRQVKNECLNVVSTCYDDQAQSLKDFSNIKDQLLLGSRLELSEEMCKQKLDACSNLYGGGPDGLLELLEAMRKITDQKIAKECRTTLQEFARDMCAVPTNDSKHTYPYGCRVYAPGEQKYATIDKCNRDLTGELSRLGDQDGDGPKRVQSAVPKIGYIAEDKQKKYTQCNPGYYMAFNGNVDLTPKPGNTCLPCTAGVAACGGKTYQVAMCGEDYVGSLYQKMVRYALQTCVRPGEAINPIPETILGDVNMVMDSIRADMAAELSAECDRLGGYWVDTPWIDVETIKNKNEENDVETTDDKNEPIAGADGIHDITRHELFKTFYTETGANRKWGYCADKSTVYKNMGVSGSYTSGNGTGDGTGGTSGGNSGGGSSGNDSSNETGPWTIYYQLWCANGCDGKELSVKYSANTVNIGLSIPCTPVHPKFGAFDGWYTDFIGGDKVTCIGSAPGCYNPRRDSNVYAHYKNSPTATGQGDGCYDD